jgi:hypothetical protein
VPFEMRAVDELAELLGGVAAAKKELKKRGVQVWEGMYNHGAYTAFEAEPKRSNLNGPKKELSTLAETDGLGAMKSLLDSIGLDITLHQYHRTNWLMLRNAEGSREHVKVYVTQRFANRHGRASFVASGFLTPQASAHYMFVCFEGPRAWVMSRRKLTYWYNKVFRKNGKHEKQEHIKPLGKDPEGIQTTFNIPLFDKRFVDGATILAKGRLQVTFDPKDEFRLLKASQLGL